MPLIARLRKSHHWPALQLCTSSAFAPFEARLATTLAYEEVTSPAADLEDDKLTTICMLHGLLGLGRNWRSFTKRLAYRAAELTSRPWRVLLVDQRNHGNSGRLAGLDPPHTLQSSAADVAHLLDNVLGDRPLHALLGHSLGGKVALSYLQQAGCSQSGHAPMKLPKQVWVLDSMVGRAKLGKEEPSDVFHVIQEVRKIPIPVPSREWLYKHLKSKGFSEGLQLWLGSSLVTRQGGGLEWTFNIEGAADMYDDYQVQEFWDITSSPPENVQLHLVRAEQSDRWSQSAIETLQQSAGKSGGATQVHALPNAGHWLHVDNPDGLLKLLAPQLSQL